MLRNGIVEDVKPRKKIPVATQNLLWGRAGGRCQFKGCNRLLWKSENTQREVNIAEQAHIYAFSPSGPRGVSGMTKDELNQVSNLLLMCHPCHKDIDKNNGEVIYPVELLKKWKHLQEERIEKVSDIDPGHHAVIVLYSANIHDARTIINYEVAAQSLLDEECFPATHHPIDLQTRGSEGRDRDAMFWRESERDLDAKFGRLLEPRLATGEIKKVALYGLAPIPLLIRLGSLFTEIAEVSTFQLHRTPKGWSWPTRNRSVEPLISRPKNLLFPPVLIVSLTAHIDRDRVLEVIEGDHSIWELSISDPNHSCIKSKLDLLEMTHAFRTVIEEIQNVHGSKTPLKIFPASPVSAMIELGRIRQPKVAQPWIIYDQVNERNGFVEALTIN